MCGGGRETLIVGIEKGACCGLKENVGKVDSTPPPINPYIELERENPRSLKNWCHVVYGSSSVGAWPTATHFGNNYRNRNWRYARKETAAMMEDEDYDRT